MKTIDFEESTSSSTCQNKEPTDIIDSKRNQNLLKCNKFLAETYDVLKPAPEMGLKGNFYRRVFSKSNVSQDVRSQSLPNSLDEQKSIVSDNLNDTSNCDTVSKLLPESNTSPPSSPTNDLWFNTWPERYEKIKSVETSPTNGSLKTNSTRSINNTQINNKLCDKSEQENGNSKNILTLNEALKNISLAYSPITKQLHLVEIRKDESVEQDNSKDEVDHLCVKINNAVVDNNNLLNKNDETGKKPTHRRTEAGSFSSTVSSLSEPSTCGSLLDPDERSLSSFDESVSKTRKKSITNFFNRNVFSSWRSAGSNSSQNNNTSVWKLFSKSVNESLPGSPQHHAIASSTALIQNERPSTLPAKTLEEEQRHREQYKAILAAAKKKEAQQTAAKQKLQKLQLQQEEQQAASTKHFTQNVLNNWDVMCSNKKTKDLWWQGLPSSVRGKVWRLAIGNELNVTPQLYEICTSRAQNRLNSSPGPSHNKLEVDQESSMDVIQLDISRTFPHLCIFQEGGPYSYMLHSLLAAYVCYRPDVGYVQGMSFIAAILILNMEPYDAFTCFANLLNQPLHLSAFTLNQSQMKAYYDAYNTIFNYNLPKLHLHFHETGLTPDLYLLDWIYTIFAKAMPLDVACRVWDVFLRDGYEFIFRTALGILHLHQDVLMGMDFLHGAQFLTRLPDDLSSDQLFKSIQTVTTNVGKQTFTQIVDSMCNNSASSISNR